jgi:hypothetical protein
MYTIRKKKLYLKYYKHICNDTNNETLIINEINCNNHVRCETSRNINFVNVVNL